MRKPRQVQGERLSIPYFPGVESTSPFAGVQGRAFLFVRDLPLGIMPYRGHEDDSFDVSLEPAKPDVADWLARLLAPQTHHNASLADSMCDFIHELVAALAYGGDVHYEIVHSPQTVQEEPRLPAAELVVLPPGRVVRMGNRYVQFVPKYARDEIGKRWVLIPSDRIWRLRFPRTLGSPRQYRKLLRHLRDVSDLIPAFAMTPAMGSDVPGYDLDTFQFMTSAELEHLTRRWGTIPSLQRVEGTTEFYFFAQTLRFRRSQALVREQIIDDVNDLLKRFGVESRVSIAGLPTSDQIAQLALDLQLGKIDFAQAAEASRTP